MRTTAAIALTLLLALPAAADEQAARDANPDVADSLDAILHDVAGWSQLAQSCGEEPCELMKSEAEAIADGLEALWPVVGQPQGKREVVDAAYDELMDHVDAFERWMPQTDLEDLDARCRQWTRTREKIDRFKRTMRQLVS
jgi:glucose/arabinose dehydrogenase